MYGQIDYDDKGSAMRIGIIRPDSIGDAVLASSMLVYFKQAFPQAEIIVICQDFIKSLYIHCPYVDDVIAFNKRQFSTHNAYRKKLLQDLSHYFFDAIFNTVFTRERSLDCLATLVGASRTVAFRVMQKRGRYGFAWRYNWRYTDLITPLPGWQSELGRHQEFLAYLGIQSVNLQPALWLGADDELYAENFFIERGLINKKVIALFAGAQYACRDYSYYGKALYEAFGNDPDIVVLGFGAMQDADITTQTMAGILYDFINLCGVTTLLQAAALLKRCTFGLGAETGLAHIACAVGLPHVIILGGGHIGRFMPYSFLTTSVILPLNCYGCDWRCKYATEYCVKSVQVEVVAYALKIVKEEPLGKKPRVFMQKKLPIEHDTIAWQKPDKFLIDVEYYYV